jgi:group I intron endonuclease
MSGKIEPGIYRITCLPNRKVWIGASNQVQRRIRAQLLQLEQNKHQRPELQKDWNRYGANSFRAEVVELCSLQRLWRREIFWIKKLRSAEKQLGYNIASGGQGSSAKRSPESRKKMSISAKQRCATATGREHMTRISHEISPKSKRKRIRSFKAWAATPEGRAQMRANSIKCRGVPRPNRKKKKLL